MNQRAEIQLLAPIVLAVRPSLKERVRRFYTDNPEEELTHASLRAKFGVTKWTAVWVLRELVDEGLLESVHVVRLRVKGIARKEL